MYVCGVWVEDALSKMPCASTVWRMAGMSQRVERKKSVVVRNEVDLLRLKDCTHREAMK